jgi:AraC-like DNA-binding protein
MIATTTLTETLSALMAGDGSREILPGLTVHRRSAPIGPLHGRSRPAFCLIAQGSKDVRLGARSYHYDPAHYLIASVELPVISQIVEATPEQPYLALRLDLDPAVIGGVMVESGQVSATSGPVHAMGVSSIDEALLDAATRLVHLAESPEHATFLAPLVMREIVYRLLQGEQGDRLRQIAVRGGTSHRVLPAIERMRREMDRPFRVEAMATDLGMSVSSFHHQFKEVTALSPLQYLKQLRLQEARRLMLAEDIDATRAGFAVGYEDVAQFNREYKRLFGEPPMRDVTRLRMGAMAMASADA